MRFEDAHIDDVQHLTETINRPPRLYTLHEMVLVETKAWHDLDDARIAFVIKTSLDQHITHTPTIIVLDRSSRGEAYDAQFNEPTAQLLPRWYVEFWRRPDLGFTQQEVESLRGWGRFLPKMASRIGTTGREKFRKAGAKRVSRTAAASIIPAVVASAPSLSRLTKRVMSLVTLPSVGAPDSPCPQAAASASAP